MNGYLQGDLYIKKNKTNKSLNKISIYQLIFGTQGTYLQTLHPIDFLRDLKSITLKELDNNYTSLGKVLLNSEYIGKYGYRKTAIEEKDNSFALKTNELKLVLYRNEDFIIWLEEADLGKILVVASGEYVNNWCFVNSQQKIFREPKDLYKFLYGVSIEQLKDFYTTYDAQNLL